MKKLCNQNSLTKTINFTFQLLIFKINSNKKKNPTKKLQNYLKN